MVRPPGGQSVRIGLALSGSGLRAAYFQLGAIRMLEELRIMEHIEVISATGGGSLAGGYYLVEMHARLAAEPDRSRIALCDEIIEDFLTSTERGLVIGRRNRLGEPWHKFKARLGKLQPGSALAETIERQLFDEPLTLADLPHVNNDRDREVGPFFTVPRLLINTTCLTDGRRMVYGRESNESLKEQIDCADRNALSLAGVMAASAADVDAFGAVELDDSVLTDGGIADSQGMETLLDYFELSPPEQNKLTPTLRQPENHVHAPIHLLVCDGSAPSVCAATPNGLSSVVTLMQSENRRRILGWLSDKLREPDRESPIAGLCVVHPQIEAEPEDIDGVLPRELVRALAGLRATLGPMTRCEREYLMYHGYLLLAAQMRRHNRSLLPREISLSSVTQGNFSVPPTSISVWSQEDARGLRARARMLDHMRLGARTSGRTWSRHRGMVLPFVVIAALIARGLTHAMFTTIVDQSVFSGVMSWVRRATMTTRGSTADQLFSVGFTALFLCAIVLAGFWLYDRFKYILRFEQRAEDASVRRAVRN
jgi:predicted acylesterase/phospholipase RssA